MAIVFDSAVYGGVQYNSLSFSHTCTGNDLLLVVGVFTSSTNTVSGVTYNSVALTKIGSSLAVSAGSQQGYSSIWYLMNPDTGENTVVISAGDSNVHGGAASYRGVKQTDQPEASITNSGFGATLTTNIDTITDNSWVIGISFNANDTSVGGQSGTTIRAIGSGSGNKSLAMLDGGNVASAGTTSIVTYDGGAISNQYHSVSAFARTTNYTFSCGTGVFVLNRFDYTFTLNAGTFALIGIDVTLKPSEWTYAQSFESLTLGGINGKDDWTDNNGDLTKFNVVNSLAYTGNQSLMQSTGVNGAVFSCSHAGNSTYSGVDEMYISVRRSANNSGQQNIILYNEDGDIEIRVRLYSNGQIQSYDGDTWTQIDSLTYSANTWYRLGIKWDYATANKWYVNVNNGAWSTALPFINATGTGIEDGKMYLSHGGEAGLTGYFDAIGPTYDINIPYLLEPVVGVFTFDGIDAILIKGHNYPFGIEVGDFIVTGVSANFTKKLYTYTLDTKPGASTFTFNTKPSSIWTNDTKI